MDAVLDRALSLRGVTGVLVLTRDSWLTIASRGALTSNDAPRIERLLHWTEEDSTGSIPWLGGEGGRCIHFHRAPTHTLILLRQQPRSNLSPSIPRPRPRLASQQSTQSPNPNPNHSPSLNFGLGSFSPRLGLTLGGGAPRMRFGWSRSSTESHVTDATNANDVDTHHSHSHTDNSSALQAGSASLSLFAPSPSHRNAELAVHNVHRPSSWC